MTIKEAIKKVITNTDLYEDEMTAVMEEIMTGAASPAQIGAFITALRMKGETVSEITGAARVMREKAEKVYVPYPIVVDTCGTGGDESMTFNISTAAAFVVAGCGAIVAKHGNRSVSSRSGSADVLKSLGVDIEAPVKVVEECITDIGIGFLFAPLMHGAMKHAAPVRRELGIRTVFNLLGPLTNPAGARYHVLGVYDQSLTDTIAKVLFNLGSEHAFVVCGDDGLDEISLVEATKVTELKAGVIKSYHLTPEDIGMKRCKREDIMGGSPEENARIINEVFRGAKGPARDIVIVNAAPGIVVSGKARTISEGIAVARGVIDSGEALKKLEGLVERTNRR